MIDSPVPCRVRPAAEDLGQRQIWVARVLCVVAVILVTEATRRLIGYTTGDLPLVLTPSTAIATGHFSHAYVISPHKGPPPTFQPPGFPLFAGGVMYVLSHFGVVARSAINVATATTVVAVMAGGIMVLRAINVSRRWELVFLVGLALDPVFAQTLWQLYHPQDVLALGLVLAGVASGLRAQWIWAGVCLGAALACKQTAVLALLPLVVIAPSRRRIWFLASAGVTATAIFAPLCATNWNSVRQIVQGPQPSGIGLTFLDQLHLPLATESMVARLGPLAASALLAAILLVLTRRGPLTDSVALGTVLAALCGRTIFEVIPTAYYLFPASVGLLLLAVSRKQPIPTALWFLAAGVWFDTPNRLQFSYWISAIAYLVLSVSAVAICLVPMFTRTPASVDDRASFA